jgi:hypothetical protein
MFKVTLHSGGLKSASFHNMLGKLDFGYEKLDAVATYKAELFTNGIGSHDICHVENYPRWSASLWDLVARIVCQALYVKEELPTMPSSQTEKDRAYVREMCAIVEHWADGEETRRARVATAVVTMQERRCNYVCALQDDLTGAQTSSMFRHAPEAVTHWDLLARGIAWTLHEKPGLPVRPPLRIAPSFVFEGESYIGVGRLRQPARDGLLGWMSRKGLPPPRVVEDAPSGIVKEATYAKFLREAL